MAAVNAKILLSGAQKLIPPLIDVLHKVAADPAKKLYWHIKRLYLAEMGMV